METVVTASEDMLENIDTAPTDEAAEIAQNIAAVIATPRGSVPLARKMGLPMKHLHLPSNLALAQFEAELAAALDDVEPRAEIAQVTASRTGDGEMNPRVEVTLHGG